jgi:ATP-binding cassette, subfamily D (ALD), peroxisomal long-chain fatty acid import protein
MIGGTYLALQAKPRDPGQGRTRHKSKQVEGGRDKNTASDKDGSSKPKRVQVDAVFYARLRAILRIVIPGIRSKEAMLLVMHTSLLVFRTAVSIYVANLDGKWVLLLLELG